MDEKMPELYLIGNGHLDPVWLWQLPEGLSEIKATFQSALDRMEEFPGYIFTSACAGYYAWVEANEPAMFEKIKARIAEGRWAIAGGMWVQPDCNIPCGESFARHLLYSQRYFREKFGRIAKVGYNVDSFGHNGMLPQLLKKAGIDSYVYMRPNQQLEKPELTEYLFHWEAPDGSRVLTYRIPSGYGDGGCKREIYEPLVEQTGVPCMVFYGVGNHGGGPTIKRLQELEGWMAEDDRYQYSSPERYFDEVRQRGLQLPVVRDDLQHHASGCYSLSAPIKKNNRKAESALLSAEKFDCMAAHLLGTDSRQPVLTQNWKKLLFHQFHDILAGCCIRDALEDAQYAVGGIIDRAEEVTQFHLQKMAWSINTHRTPESAPVRRRGRFWEKEGEGAPVVVFNPHGYPVRVPVQLNNGMMYELGGICDSQGNYLPFQKVRARFTDRGYNHNYLFMAQLPAYGYKTYYIYRNEQHPVAVDNAPSATDNVLENQNLRVEFDREHGWIERLIDKRTGKQVNAGPLSRAVLVDDTTNDTWAHKVFSFEGQVGTFGNASYRILENGPLRAGIRVVSHYGASTLWQDYYLCDDSDHVEVNCRLFFGEKFRFLRLCFEADLQQPKATYAMPFGTIDRVADGKENPAQCWASVRDEEKGIAVLTDCKYSFSALGNTLRVVLARSCCYADHFGVRDGLEEHMDLGEQQLRYCIYPHGRLKVGTVQRKLALLQQPVRWLHETYHDGSLAPEGGYLSKLPDNVILEAVKTGEDGGTVARLYETDGEATEVTLTLLGQTLKLGFAPHEIKTVRFTADGAPVETSLLEESLLDK